MSPKTVELGGLMLKAVSNHTGWTVRLQFPDQQALSDLWEYCENENISFDLQQMYRQQNWTDSEPVPLTDAQREALVVAYEEGYFAEPRDISLEELGEILDLSPTAVGGRIRRGMAELITAILINE